ncbi:MAG TPA: hypothetical protein VFS94_03500 [Gemmatimonadales bacterium]|nr:hypothetical protein [Gemmatimonadales bacterium]
MSRTASPVVLAALLLALASPLAAQQDTQRPVPTPRATEQPRAEQPRAVEPRREEPRRETPRRETPRPEVRRDPPAVERPKQAEPRQKEPRSTGEPELRRRKPE